MPNPMTEGLGEERLTVDATVGGVTLADIPSGATHALMRVKDAAICFTDSSTAPTATVGMEAEVGDLINFDGNLRLFKAIRRDGADAELVVSYFRYVS